MNLPTSILVATDFSETSEAAVDYAVALAAKLGARLFLLNVLALPSYGVPELGVTVTPAMLDGLVADNQAALDRLIKKYAPMKIEPTLLTGDPRDVIVRTAHELEVDLIVMGTHGRRGVRRALLGSVAESVLRHAHCPVLTIRSPH